MKGRIKSRLNFFYWQNDFEESFVVIISDLGFEDNIVAKIVIHIFVQPVICHFDFTCFPYEKRNVFNTLLG